jgi:hypothetical protein
LLQSPNHRQAKTNTPKPRYVPPVVPWGFEDQFVTFTENDMLAHDTYDGMVDGGGCFVLFIYYLMCGNCFSIKSTANH